MPELGHHRRRVAGHRRLSLFVELRSQYEITLADARRVLAAAERKAEEIKQPMNIAVVDAGGNLVAHVRMDKAWIGSVDIAINKAWTARAFDISTKELAELSSVGRPVLRNSRLQSRARHDLRGRHPSEAGGGSRRRHRCERRHGKTGSGRGGSQGGGLLTITS